jgi:hypothetical protein
VSGRTLRAVLDTRQGRPSEAIAAAVRAGAFMVLTHRLVAELSAELGGDDAAARFLHRLVEDTGRPLGVNVPTATDSQTTFWAPASWTPERLRGWVGAHHEALERQFGSATIRKEPAT